MMKGPDGYLTVKIPHLKKQILAIFIILLFTISVNGQYTYQTVEVLYDSAWTYKNLQLIPIRFKVTRGNSSEAGFITLSEAMLSKKAELRELPEKIGSHKGAITITNKGNVPIVVQSGELLSGGKQDRVLSKTTIIPPKSKKEVLTTYCVEEGRWSRKSKPFRHGGTGDVELRKAIDIRKSQAAVWKEIERQYHVQENTSKTWSYLELGTDSSRWNRDYHQYFKQKLQESKGGFAGFLFVTGNSILSVELFDNSDLTNVLFETMLASYVNSIGKKPDPPMVSTDRQKTFLDNVLSSREVQQSLIKKHGGAYRYENKILHMIVYGDGF